MEKILETSIFFSIDAFESILPHDHKNKGQNRDKTEKCIDDYLLFFNRFPF